MSDLTVSTILPASPQEIYDAWLDSAAHSSFTGQPAEIEACPGCPYTAYDGYIQGMVLELEPPNRVLMTWRSTDFPAGADDSVLEIQIEPVEGGSRLTLVQTGIPGDSPDYADGWQKYYFTPLLDYFTVKTSNER